jgi:hypothetical protein
MAKKIHARRKRYMPRGNERNRAPRLKSFLTVEAATKHAQSLGLKKFKIARTNFGLGKKFRIHVEE